MNFLKHIVSCVFRIITFNFLFHSNDGDIPHVVGSHDALGDWGRKDKLRMNPEGEDFWTVDVRVPVENLDLEYKFFFINETSGKQVFEEGPNRVFAPDSDVYTDRSNEAAHVSAVNDGRSEYRMATLYLPYRLNEGEKVYPVGDCLEMGNWKYNDQLSMTKVNENGCKIDLCIPNTEIRYKYVAVDRFGSVRWENGGDRVLLPNYTLVVDSWDQTSAHRSEALNGGDNAEAFYRSDAYTNEFADEFEQKQESVSESLPMSLPMSVVCTICCEPKDADAMVSCTRGCAVCRDCLKTYLESEVKINPNKATVSCMAGIGCDGEYTPPCIQSVLEDNTSVNQRLVAMAFTALLRTESLETERNLVHCPFCYYYEIIEADVHNVADMNCKNPECMKVSCRKCRRETHPNQPCEENVEDIVSGFMKFVEGRMSEARIRTCPCGILLSKDGGCNHFTCECGREMCYRCRTPLTPDSWNAHFTPGNNPMNCQLFDNQEQGDQECVVTAMEQAIQELSLSHPLHADVIRDLSVAFHQFVSTSFS